MIHIHLQCDEIMARLWLACQCRMQNESLPCSFPAVNFICDHPAIKAISFVGSNQAGEYIYERGSKNGKRVQSNMVSLCH